MEGPSAQVQEMSGLIDDKSCQGVAAPSAQSLLEHMIMTETCLAVSKTVLQALWCDIGQSCWCTLVTEFSDPSRRAEAASAMIANFRVALTNCILLAEALSRANRQAGDPSLQLLMEDVDGHVFGHLLPTLFSSFATAHDPLWDEICASLLPVCSLLARVAVGVESSNRNGSRRRASRGIVLEWILSVLNADMHVSPIVQNVVLLYAIGIDLDVDLVCHIRRRNQQPSRTVVGNAFHAVFLQCANMLSDRVLITLLLKAVMVGSIKGNELYATDLDVLLCVLQRMSASTQNSCEQQNSNDFPSVLQQCELTLLRDIAPSQSATSDDVIAWVQRLSLRHGDYSSVIRTQGIDGEVLWSDLTVEDIIEMGIHCHEDARRIFDALHAVR